MIILLIILFIFLCYAALIFYYWRSWESMPLYLPPSYNGGVKISVLAPARNEEKNIGALLTALQNQRYPASLFEVIVIDDHSEDGTASIVQQFAAVKLVSLHADHINSYKKKAIETGLAVASGELIVTTDADCIPGPDWLAILSTFHQEKKAGFIAAPVVFENNSSLLQVFQSLDFLVLQGITGASVHKKIHAMCNGANLAYEKTAFDAVNGFAGIDHIASGDDMLLMHKIAEAYPQRVFYLKSQAAIVHTQPMTSWKDFLNQRIRWASKAAQYRDIKITLVLLLVYLLNLAFPALLLLGFFHPVYWIYLCSLWILKTCVEIPFVYSVARFFGKQKLVGFFFFLQPLHIFYTLIAGLLGQLGSYEWKGRKVK